MEGRAILVDPGWYCPSVVFLLVDLTFSGSCRIPRLPAPAVSAAVLHRCSVPLLWNYHRLYMRGSRRLEASLVEQHPQPHPDDGGPHLGRVCRSFTVSLRSKTNPGASPCPPPRSLDRDTHSDLRIMDRQPAEVAHECVGTFNPLSERRRASAGWCSARLAGACLPNKSSGRSGRI